MSFANLKKSSTSSFAKLAEQINKSESKQSYSDDRFWTPAVDKDGNGMSIIRFLPEVDGEDAPYVKLFRHSFKNDANQYYIENCRTTIGGKCLCCEENSKEWKKGTDEAKAIVRNRSRATSYISNILVINDVLNPENNGKVFLFSYGKKIFEKIMQQIKPEFGEAPVNIFDFWEGANFKLKIRKVSGYRNYDLSVFDPQTKLFDGDDKRLEDLWNSQYKLQEFISEGNFKPEVELDNKFKAVYPELFNSVATTTSSTQMSSRPTFNNVQSNPTPATPEEEDDDMRLYQELLA